MSTISLDAQGMDITLPTCTKDCHMGSEENYY